MTYRALRKDQSDYDALLGAYSNWLARLVRGCRATPSGMMFGDANEAVGHCGGFLMEARYRGWVERQGRHYVVSAKGREAYAAFVARAPDFYKPTSE